MIPAGYGTPKLGPFTTALIAISVFVGSVPVATHLGAEFMPKLEDGDLLIEAVRLPTALLEGSIAMSTNIEKLLLKFGEVQTVFCKTGRPEIANDVMGVHQTDVWVLLKPHHEWPQPKPRDQLIEEMSEVLNSRVPGVMFGFTQPIEMRVDVLVAGVKVDVAVLLYGDDLEVLGSKAKEIERLLKNIPGAADVKADYQGNLSTLRIEPHRDALARLRPVLMTAMVAGLGFLPMALSHSDGAEMQRPLVTVVIGGLVTSTLLTSLVVPAIYPWFVPRSVSAD